MSDATTPAATTPVPLDDVELALVCVAVEETLRPTWEARGLLAKLYSCITLNREMDARQSKAFAAALVVRQARPYVNRANEEAALEDATARRGRRARVAGVEALTLFAVSRYEEVAIGGAGVVLYASFADHPDPAYPTLLLRLDRERWEGVQVGLRYDIAFAGGDLKRLEEHDEIGSAP